MQIVLDSSVIVGDYRFSTPTSRLLLENLRLVGHTLVIPEVVLREVVNKFQEQLAADVAKLRDTARSVSEKVGTIVAPGLHPTGVAKEVEAYETYLRTLLKCTGSA